ncbi:guanine deaminase [Cellvibrio sp. OA-2007]|uniref:guanine deaminase n=1 Tax=Cellvibrio sp. OA-2007 TaxID=529823 RepID=UPI000780AC9C|nr:guanine deaminase [Cellvibrio sp. OA-2007]
MTADIRAFRAQILHFIDAPNPQTGAGVEYFADGVLLVEHGRIKAVGDAQVMAAQGLDLTRCEHFPEHLLMPGFIDSHIHCPQAGVIASYGEQLLDWLNLYTFPAELQFSDPDFAAAAAEQFLQFLLQNGTTSAMVYTTVFAQSTHAFFTAAEKLNMRMIAGKVTMDRHAPAALLDTAQTSYADCRELIDRWHNIQRLHYALTPRFALTSSPEQLALTGKLYREYPDLYLQTHLAENPQEIALIKSLYPSARDYLDVYDHYGLLGSRSVFGHGIHLSELEIERLAQTQSGIAFCPTSNLFLGSGLLDMARLERAGISVSLATDVGGGTSFSQLRSLAEAYKILQLQGQSLHPLKGFYMATLGNARALQLDHCIGNFAPGKEADFILINLAATPLQTLRQSSAQTLAEKLFALMMLGDEHNIARVYIMGKLMFQRAASSRG